MAMGFLEALARRMEIARAAERAIVAACLAVAAAPWVGAKPSAAVAMLAFAVRSIAGRSAGLGDAARAADARLDAAERFTTLVELRAAGRAPGFAEAIERECAAIAAGADRRAIARLELGPKVGVAAAMGAASLLVWLALYGAEAPEARRRVTGREEAARLFAAAGRIEPGVPVRSEVEALAADLAAGRLGPALASEVASRLDRAAARAERRAESALAALAGALGIEEKRGEGVEPDEAARAARATAESGRGAEAAKAIAGLENLGDEKARAPLEKLIEALSRRDPDAAAGAARRAAEALGGGGAALREAQATIEAAVRKMAIGAREPETRAPGARFPLSGEKEAGARGERRPWHDEIRAARPGGDRALPRAIEEAVRRYFTEADERS
jgi:hypothetical protein